MDNNRRIAFIAQKRTTLKSQLTATLTALTQGRIDASNAALRLNRLTELFHNYEELHDELALLEPNRDQFDELNEIQDRFYNIATRINNMQRSNRSQSDETVPISPMGNSTFLEKQKVLKLPVAKLPQFNGDLDKWLSFKNMFSVMIDARTDIDDLIKFFHLKESLSGDALKKISIYDASNENYRRAWDTLIDSYDKKRILVSKHLDAILDITPLTKATAVGLSKLVDDVRQHLNLLKSLEACPDDGIVLRVLERALPTDIRQKWEESLNLDTLPDLTQIFKFLSETSFRLCSAEQDNIRAKRETGGKRRAEHDRTSTRFLRNASGSRALVTADVPACIKCREFHPLHRCKEFSDLTADQRLNFVKAKGVCRNCLRAHAGSCPSSRCKRCHKFHHTHLHEAVTNANISNRSTLSNADSFKRGPAESVSQI